MNGTNSRTHCDRIVLPVAMSDYLVSTIVHVRVHRMDVALNDCLVFTIFVCLFLYLEIGSMVTLTTHANRIETAESTTFFLYYAIDCPASLTLRLSATIVAQFNDTFVIVPVCACTFLSYFLIFVFVLCFFSFSFLVRNILTTIKLMLVNHLHLFSLQ